MGLIVAEGCWGLTLGISIAIGGRLIVGESVAKGGTGPAVGLPVADGGCGNTGDRVGDPSAVGSNVAVGGLLRVGLNVLVVGRSVDSATDGLGDCGEDGSAVGLVGAVVLVGNIVNSGVAVGDPVSIVGTGDRTGRHGPQYPAPGSLK